jgi:hypothetical protein
MMPPVTICRVPPSAEAIPAIAPCSSRASTIRVDSSRRRRPGSFRGCWGSHAARPVLPSQPHARVQRAHLPTFEQSTAQNSTIFEKAGIVVPSCPRSFTRLQRLWSSQPTQHGATRQAGGLASLNSLSGWIEAILSNSSGPRAGRPG